MRRCQGRKALGEMCVRGGSVLVVRRELSTYPTPWMKLDWTRWAYCSSSQIVFALGMVPVLAGVFIRHCTAER